MPDHNNLQNDWEMNQPDLTAEHPRHQRLVEPLISLYQDGEATGEEAATVERYLATCAECRALNDGFASLNGSLAAYMEAIPAPRFDRRNYPFLAETPAALRADSPARPVVLSGSPFTNDRNSPAPTRRPGFAYNLAGGLAAALLIGLVAAFLLLVMQQVSQNKDSNPGTVQAAAAGQTQEAAQNQTAQVEQSPTPPVTTAPATQAPATQAPAPTEQAGTAADNTPDTGAAPGGPTPAALTSGATQKTQPNATQKPVPTSTLAAVPTNTPAANRTSASQPAATPAPEPPARPTTAASASSPPPAVTTAAPASPTAPAETAAPTLEATSPPNPTASPAPPTPGETSASAPGWIAYVDQSDGQIHLVKADGQDDQVISDPTVSRNFEYEDLVWSNDGKLLVAVGLDNNTGSRSIYLLDIANPLRVEELAVGFAPAFSPDNLSIAFLSGPATIKNGALYGKPAIYSLKKRTVTTVNTLADSFKPQWFADSTRLLIGQDRIYDADSATISTFKLPFTNTCLAASLSPSGDKLANLELQADGSYQTVIYDLGKGTLDAKHPLARTSAALQGKIGLNCGTQRLNWTPDSHDVYYYVNNGATGATCLVQASGGGSRCLTNVYDPSFNSDGSALVDSSPTTGGGGQVYTADANITGRPPRPRLIAESLVSPVWQPL